MVHPKTSANIEAVSIFGRDDLDPNHIPIEEDGIPLISDNCF